MTSLSEVNRILQNAISSMARVWREIGFSEADQSAYIDSLLDKIVNMVGDFATAQENKKDVMTKEIISKQNEISAICRGLGEEQNPILSRLDDFSLYQAHTTVSNLLKEVSQLRDERVRMIESVENELMRVWNDLEIMNDRLPQFKLSNDCLGQFSLRRLENSQSYLASAQKDLNSLKLSMQNDISVVRTLWAELNIPTSESGSKLENQLLHGPETITPSRNTANRISGLRRKLEEEKDRREQRVNELRVQIEMLWDKLEIPEEDRSRFRSSYSGLDFTVFTLFENELQRLHEIKMQRIPELCVKLQGEVEEMWDRLFCSEKERQEASSHWPMAMSEAFLALLEDTLAALNEQYQRKLPVLSLLEKKQELLQKKAEVEEMDSANSSKKYNGRGGALLRQCALRKEVDKGLPLVERKIRAALEKWDQEHPEDPFLYNGEDLRVVMEREKAEEEALKELDKMEKQEKKRRDAAEAGLPLTTPRKFKAKKVPDSSKKPEKELATPRRPTTRSTATPYAHVSSKLPQGASARHPPTASKIPASSHKRTRSVNENTVNTATPASRARLHTTTTAATSTTAAASPAAHARVSPTKTPKTYTSLASGGSVRVQGPPSPKRTLFTSMPEPSASYNTNESSYSTFATLDSDALEMVKRVDAFDEF